MSKVNVESIEMDELIPEESGQAVLNATDLSLIHILDSGCASGLIIPC